MHCKGDVMVGGRSTVLLIALLRAFLVYRQFLFVSWFAALITVHYILLLFMHRLRYGHGRVRDISELKSYEVQFEDGTICSDMSRGDVIVSCMGNALCHYLLVELCAGSGRPCVFC